MHFSLIWLRLLISVEQISTTGVDCFNCGRCYGIFADYWKVCFATMLLTFGGDLNQICQMTLVQSNLYYHCGLQMYSTKSCFPCYWSFFGR